MKITVLWLFLFMHFFVIASGQKITLELKNVALEVVFQNLKRQTGYYFLYDADAIRHIKKLSLQVKDVTLEQALDICMEDLPLKYVIQEKSIIVSKESYITNLDIEKSTDNVQSSISGEVVNEKGEAIPGVTVRIKGGITMTATDEKGRFSIQVPGSSAVLVFSIVGYSSKEVNVGSQRDIKVALTQSVSALDAVVVTALGITREERSLGYSVSEVDGDDFKKVREPNVINSLAGKVPGLSINTTAGGPAGSSRVIIRGATSITGNNQPLYVIDGVPMDNSNYGQVEGSKYSAGFDMGDAISAINPEDIDKISVLKGPAAAAVYGSRAANGVILITTKKGGRQDLGIEFNSTMTFENQLTRFDGYQNLYGQGRSQELVQDQDQARTSMFNNFGPRMDPNLMMPYFDGVVRPYAYVPDNISGFFRTGSTYTNNVAVTNGTENNSFRLAISDLRNNDIVPGSSIRRNTFTLSGTSKLGEKLKVEATGYYLNEDVVNRPALADDPSNIGNNFVGLARNVDQALFKNYYKDDQGTYVDWGGGQYRLNPYWIIHEMRNNTQKDRLRGNLQVNYTITDWMSLQGRVGTDITFLDFEKFTPRTTPGSLTGRLNTRNQRYVTTESDILLSAQKQVSEDWHLSARLGASLSRVHNGGTTDEFLNMNMTDLISPNSFADKTVLAHAFRKHNNSVYTLVGVGYKGYLYADATLRRDVSSTLPTDNNTYYYPSISGSFVFTDAFKMDKQVLSMGRLRASAAEVGNDTDPYQLDLYYDLNPLTFRSQSLGKVASPLLPNPNLKPTRTRSFEIGTELKFWGERLGVDFTYYTQRSRDQINRVPLPMSSGFREQVVNAGVILNRGVEIGIRTQPVSNEKVHWDLNFNFARNKNEVESLAEGIPFLTLSEARWMGVAVVAMPGAPYGSILGYGYKRDPDGNIILNPSGLTPMVSDERELIGQGTFLWTGGLYSSVSYKNFGLTTVLDMKTGADIFSMSNLFADARGSSVNTLAGREEWIQSEEERMAGGYTEQQWQDMGMVRGYVPEGVVQTGVDGEGEPIYAQNTRAVDPSIYWANVYHDSQGIAIPYIYDASYLKVREITLSYRVPSKLTSRWGVRDLSIAVVSRNPFIIYKSVPNIDPDSNYNNGNGQGFEYGSLPSRRSWGMNLNFRF